MVITMTTDFSIVLDSLKPVLSGCLKRLSIKSDTGSEYALETKSPSPFPQHKGHPLAFGSVRIGKAYVSLHLMPIYMSPSLNQGISADLKKRMQGKACFNFKSRPDQKLLTELKALAQASLKEWDARGWL
jgi:hypothetical protein